MVKKICVKCGEFLEDDETCRHDDNIYCQSCFDDNFIMCEICMQFVSIHESRMHDDYIYCHDCFDDEFTFCEGCHEYYKNDDTVHTHDCNYCFDCIGELFYTCDDCGDYVSINNYYNDDDGIYCYDCYSSHSHIINNCNYTPDLNFHGEGLHIGIELEIECPCASCEDVAETMIDTIGDNNIYCKHDGSLNDGFEIVTHPMTYQYIIDNKILHKVSEIALNNECKSHNTDTCGMHIHVERKGLSTLQIYRLLTFFRTYQEQIVQISQRKPENLRQWSNINTDRKSIMYKCKNRRSGDKYDAINTRHSDTIEFRIFRGNLRIDRILKNIQFIISLVNYTQYKSLQVISWCDYVKYVTDNKKDYKELYNFIINTVLND